MLAGYQSERLTADLAKHQLVCSPGSGMGGNPPAQEGTGGSRDNDHSTQQVGAQGGDDLATSGEVYLDTLTARAAV